MTSVFVDTSAIYALVLSTDANHLRSAKTFRSLAERQARLLTSSYVLVETYALLGRRVGLDAVAAFRADLAPLRPCLTWCG
jgi:predicted nucleic acid-binding protein